MSIRFELKVQSDHVLVICEGDYEIAGALKAFEAGVEASTVHKVPRILADCRKMIGNPTDYQRYELGERFAISYSRKRGPYYPRIALVGYVPLIDPYRFGEFVAINRGVPVKVSVEMQEALEWLGIDSVGE
jgi:hypothetical protein